MKKAFFRNHMSVFILGPTFTLVTVVLVDLYDISVEFGVYFVFLSVIFWLATFFSLYKQYKKLEEQTLESSEVIDTNDDKWLEAKEKEDFFALWTHQIKTPIAALNLILQSEEPDIRQCKLETFKIESYVEMALNYLRFDTMSNDLVLEGCELERVVKAVVKKHSSIFINKHLSVSLENLNYKVLTDEKWFSFILEQIVSNALKYTKEGSITISAQQAGDEVTVCVKDTGIGIRSEDIPRLFEKGFTGFNGRMDKKASGLGLYLSKGISEKLGHRLWVESVEGQGTSVFIMFTEEKVNRNSLNKM